MDDMEQFLNSRASAQKEGAIPDRAERVVIAQILENAYTAIETALLRIAQGFDNSLSPELWHADLLDKMLLAKKGIRPAVLSEESHRLLTELMRFHHFRRYYLLSVCRRCLPLVRAELAAFRDAMLRGLEGV